MSPQHPFFVPPHRLSVNCLDFRPTIDALSINNHAQILFWIKRFFFFPRHFTCVTKNCQRVSALTAFLKLLHIVRHDGCLLGTAVDISAFCCCSELPPAASYSFSHCACRFACTQILRLVLAFVLVDPHLNCPQIPYKS